MTSPDAHSIAMTEFGVPGKSLLSFARIELFWWALAARSSDEAEARIKVDLQQRRRRNKERLNQRLNEKFGLSDVNFEDLIASGSDDVKSIGSVSSVDSKNDNIGAYSDTDDDE